MCGRYGLFRDPSPLLRAVHARNPPGFRFTPRYNVAPQQPVLGLRNLAEPETVELRWGLLGAERNAGRARLSTINARIEGVATSPLYGPLLIAKRCVIFADGYYEWPARRDGAKPQPVWIEREDRAGFAFAGLWDRASADGEPVVACTIITQPANPKLAVLHERMPVVLSVENARRWLVHERLEAPDALRLLPPADGNEWRYHPVSNAVGNVANDAPELIAPVTPIREQPTLFDPEPSGFA